jgi:hypothetical protein
MATATQTHVELGTCETLSDFVGEISELFSIIQNASPVLFRKEFREKLTPAIFEARDILKDELQPILKKLEENKKTRQEPADITEQRRKLKDAGLSDQQLALKLESYRHAAKAFDETGTRENLEGLLDVASTLMGSLLDALGFGSLVRELADLLKQELGIKLARLASMIFGRRK